MKKVSEKYRGTGEYYLVFHELVRAAQFRGTVTYQEIAHLIGHEITGSHMGTEIGRLLGEISEGQHDRKKPMLSAIAVDAQGRPGGGFFDLAKALGKIEPDSSPEQERAFLKIEQDAVYEAWRRKF